MTLTNELTPLTILVISDDHFLVQALDQAGQQVGSKLDLKRAMDVAEARAMLNKDQDVKLILLDSSVQNSTAELAFLAHTRTHTAWRHVPTLVLIDCQLPCDLVAAYQAKATSVTIKPYSAGDWSAYWQTIQQTYSLTSE
jgi:CheY-like chemotaxis protein